MKRSFVSKFKDVTRYDPECERNSPKHPAFCRIVRDGEFVTHTSYATLLNSQQELMLALDDLLSHTDQRGDAAALLRYHKAQTALRNACEGDLNE